MKYVALQGCWKKVGGAALPGEILEVPRDLDDKIARQMLAQGRIRPADPDPAPAPETGAAAEPPTASGPAPEKDTARQGRRGT